MLQHCNLTFNEYGTWKLRDNKEFIGRFFKFGKCPVCNKYIIELEETRQSDKKAFKRIETKNKALKLLEHLKPQILPFKRKG